MYKLCLNLKLININICSFNFSYEIRCCLENKTLNERENNICEK